MIQRAFPDVALSDIEALRASGIRESKTLEYKEQISKPASFLAAVCAFANSGGGDIIIGVREHEGQISGLPGLQLADTDQEVLRLQSLILNGIDPRLSGVDIKAIPTDDAFLLILRVPASWNAPHRLRENRQFYARSSAGKYPMDIDEIREKFLMAEELNQRIDAFRSERVRKISEKRTPLELAGGAVLILHLGPIGAFSRRHRISASEILRGPSNFFPMGASGCNSRVNVHGVVTYSGLKPPFAGYTQIYREGTIESTLVFEEWEGKKAIPALKVEPSLLKGVKDYVDGLIGLGFSYPFWAAVSLVGIEDFHWSYGGASRSGSLWRLPDGEVLVPSLILESGVDNISSAVKPVCDHLWNAFGFESSPPTG